jgi:hypothetical protein
MLHQSSLHFHSVPLCPRIPLWSSLLLPQQHPSNTSNMADSKHRPLVATKHTQIRAQEHLEIPQAHDLVSSRFLDSLVVGLGYSSLATYLSAHGSTNSHHGSSPQSRWDQ